jgi:hypothetical protein
MALLENVHVHVSEQISKTLSISLQGMDEVRVRDAVAYAHLEEHDGKLDIHVPSRKREQEVCFTRHLPEFLLKHFGAQPADGVGNLGLILTSSSLFSVDETLDHAGIITLRGVQRPPEEDSDFNGSSEDLLEILASRETIDVELRSSPDFTRAAQHSQRAASAPVLNTISSRARVITPEEEEDDDDADRLFLGRSTYEFDSNMYERLLNICVDRGRSLQSIPRRGASLFSPSVDENFNEMEIRQAVAGVDQKSLIGAAGELFVSN